MHCLNVCVSTARLPRFALTCVLRVSERDFASIAAGKRTTDICECESQVYHSDGRCGESQRSRAFGVPRAATRQRIRSNVGQMRMPDAQHEVVRIERTWFVRMPLRYQRHM